MFLPCAALAGQEASPSRLHVSWPWTRSERALHVGVLSLFWQARLSYDCTSSTRWGHRTPANAILLAL